MIDCFMFTLNLFIIVGVMTTESLLHHHQLVTKSIIAKQPLMITSVRKNPRLATIEVELLEYNQHNKSLVKTGVIQSFNASFSRLGTKDKVDGGFLRQLHICEDEYDGANNMSWIAVFKLESTPHLRHQCKNVITKAKLALTNNASAVIFDVSADKNLSRLLNRKIISRLNRPILTIRGRAAKKLQMLMKNHSVAKAKIKLPEVTASQVQKEDQELLGRQGYLTLVISFAVVGFLFIVAVALIIKTLGRRPPIRQALKNMRLVVYSELKDSMTDTQCSICFDEYQPIEVVRMLPCLHFFHKKCVDRWLLSKKTCPLCLLDVMSGHPTKRDKSRQSVSVSSGLTIFPTNDDRLGLCRLCTPFHNNGLSLLTTTTTRPAQLSDSLLSSPSYSQTRGTKLSSTIEINVLHSFASQEF